MLMLKVIQSKENNVTVSIQRYIRSIYKTSYNSFFPQSLQLICYIHSYCVCFLYFYIFKLINLYFIV